MIVVYYKEKVIFPRLGGIDEVLIIRTEGQLLLQSEKDKIRAKLYVMKKSV